jgi:hypothetical protein
MTMSSKSELDQRFSDLDRFFFVRRALGVNAKLHAALALKVTAETYLLLESGSLDRFLAMQLLQGSVLAENL